MARDPLKERLEDPIFAKTFESFLKIVTQRARPAKQRKGSLSVTIPEADPLQVTRRAQRRPRLAG